MKQKLPKKEWDKLSEKHKETLIKEFAVAGFYDVGILYGNFKLIIGQLIEFLGDDLIEMVNDDTDWIVRLDIPIPKQIDNNQIWKEFIDKELIIALFKAVKYKLNEKT